MSIENSCGFVEELRVSFSFLYAEINLLCELCKSALRFLKPTDADLVIATHEKDLKLVKFLLGLQERKTELEPPYEGRFKHPLVIAMKE